jgi:PAS domain S-box-containing protein
MAERSHGALAALPPDDAAFRAAWEEAADAMVLSDADGMVLAANPAYARLYGYCLDEVIGHEFTIIFPEAQRAWAMQAYRATFAAATIAPVVAATTRDATGAERQVESRYTFLTDPTGRRTAMLSIIRDVTERARAEVERAEVLAREQAARAAAQEAVRVRDSLLATISHDLKTPLVSIKGLTQYLQRSLDRQGRADDRLTRTLAGIDQAVSRMTTMLDELVDISLLQAGHTVPLAREPVDLVALARAVVAEQRQATECPTLVLEATTSALIGRWDGARLERVLTNLIGNAVKYSPNGGTVTVRVGGEADDAGHAWAVLEVHDQGLGIPATDLPHIFESFRRGGNVPGHIPGMGIGLASARQIVAQHGGQIHAASTEGHGSTFTIRLPLA